MFSAPITACDDALAALMAADAATLRNSAKSAVRKDGKGQPSAGKNRGAKYRAKVRAKLLSALSAGCNTYQQISTATGMANKTAWQNVENARADGHVRVELRKGLSWVEITDAGAEWLAKKGEDGL